MYSKFLPVIGVLAAAAILAFVAEPLDAHGLSYAGIGSTVASFQAANPNGTGKPAIGQTYYRIGDTRDERVASYHVVVGWKSKRSAAKLFTLLSGSNLPPDAKALQPYDGYCAVYRSAWLGRVIGLPYIIVYAPQHHWWNLVNASFNPVCRG